MGPPVEGGVLEVHRAELVLPFHISPGGLERKFEQLGIALLTVLMGV